MPGETKNGMQCGEFDALLNDALDGTLTGPKLESFQAHARVCALCGPLLAEADAGTALAEVAGRSRAPSQPGAQHSGRYYRAREQASGHSRRNPRSSWIDRFTAWLRPVFAPVLAAEPPAALRHVIRNGILLLVDFAQPGRGQGERRSAGRSAAERHQAHLLRNLGPGSEVLRKYSLRV